MQHNDYNRYVPFLRYEVDFLHKTVRDFLRHNWHEYLHEKAGASFNATASLCSVTLALAKAIKTLPEREALQNQLFTMVDEIMYYTHELELRGAYYGPEQLDKLDRVMATHAEAWGSKNHWTNLRESPDVPHFFKEYGQNTFLGLSI